MADIESNIDINIDASQALAAIKRLQAEISAFHQSMSKGGAKAAQESALMQQQLVNSINATGKFAASMRTVQTSTESFTESLEKNKFSLGQYFKYGASQIVGFRKIFSSEFDTIEKVARERVKTLQTQYIKLGRDANGAMKAIAVRPLALDMDDLGTKTAIAAQKAQIFNQVLKQGSTNLLNFGKNTQWAGRQLMVGFTIPLGIMGAAAAKEFMKLEEQAIRFKRVYGETFTPPEEADKMIGQIRQLGEEYTKYGVAIDKTMGIAADAAAMGKQGAELLQQVAQASNLAVLGGVDQKQALETTISLTNTFGVAADKLAGKINFLNAVENQTVTSIEDLTTAIPIAAPVIQQLGGDVEDLTFFLTAMKEGGIDAGEGANALKSGLASMINPTQEAKDQLAGFGINIEAIRDANAGDVAGMVRSLATELQGLSDLQRAQSIETMFGKFQFSRMSTLFQNVIAEGTQASRVLKLTQATTEELAVLSQRELKRVEDSPMYQFQGAVERFQAALAPIGESFIKAVTPIVNFGTEILNKFNDMGDGAKQFWTVLVAAVAGLGPILLMTFGLMANGMANVIKLFAMIRGGFIGLAGESGTLGEQTQYMSQEQLEAAAVAASLNQVHSNLIQTFTAEKSAVAGLAAVYRDAAIAIQGVQRPMMPGAPMGPAPKKYANGVFSVPGPKGAGDVVPAMLSPGEAVIPADRAEQYRGLVQGIIAGSIPGFILGIDKVGDNFTTEDLDWVNQKLGHIEEDTGDRKTKTKLEDLLYRRIVAARKLENDELVSRLKTEVEGHIQAGVKSEGALKNAMKLSPTGQSILAEIDIRTLPSSKQTSFAHADPGRRVSPAEARGSYGNLKPGSKADKAIQLAEEMQAAGYSADLDMKSGLGYTANDLIQKNMAGSAGKPGSPIGDFAADWQSRGGEKWNRAITNGGGSVSALSEQAQILTDEVSRLIEKLPSTVKTIVDTEADVDALVKRGGVREEIVSAESLIDQAKENVREVTGELQATLDRAKNRAPALRVVASQKDQDSWIDDAATPEERQRRVDLAQGAGMRSKGGQARSSSEVSTGTAAGFFDRDLATEQGYDSLGNLDKDRVAAETAAAKAMGTQVGEAYNEGVDSVSGPENDPFNVNNDDANRNSPHKQAGVNGTDDARAYAEAARAEAERQALESGASEYDARVAGNMAKQKAITEVNNREFQRQEEQKTKVAEQEAEKRRKWAEEDAELGIQTGGPAPVVAAPRKEEKLVTGERRMSNVEAAQLDAVLSSGQLNGSGSPTADKIAGKLSGGLEWLRGKSPKLAGVIDRKLEDLDRALDLQGKYQAEEEAVQQRAIAAQEKLTAAIEAEAARMAAEGIDGTPTVNPIDIIGESGVADIEAQQKLEKRQRDKAKRQQDRRNRQRVVGTVAAGASMAVGMATMVGGPVGEFAQQIAPVTMGLSMLAPMIAGLPGPIAIVVAAFAALGAGVFLTVDAMNKARDKALQFAEATGAGSKAMEKFAEFAGTATASQQLKVRRENEMNAFGVKTGKNTFGANYLQSEGGKQLLESVKERVKSGGDLTELQNTITNQMATAVATGALNPEQARSVVAQLGQEIGNVNFSVRANGELLNLLGPNGENILKDPIGVRLEIMDKSQKNMQSQLAGITGDKLANIQGQAGLGATATVGGGIAGGIAGGLGGAALGSILSGTAIGGMLGPIGAVGGAIAGAAFGAVQIADSFAKLESSAAAFTGSGVIAMQQQQEMLDSLQLQYEQRIGIAKAAGDTAEADRLSEEYIQGRSDIIAKGAEARKTMVDAFTNADSFTKGAMGRSLDSAIEQQYKDNPLLQGIAVEARNQVVAGTADTEAGNAMEYSLKLALADTTIDPQAILSLMNNFKEGDGVIEGFIQVQTNLGSADGNRTLQLMNMFVDEEGNPVTAHQTAFMSSFEGMDNAEATRFLDMMQEVSKVEGVQELNYAMEFFLENPDAGYKVLDQIKSLKDAAGDGDITFTMVQELIGGNVADIVAQNQAYFDSLDKDQRVTYTQTLLTVYETRGTPEYKGQLKNWLAATGQTDKWTKGGGIDATEAQLMKDFEAEQAYKVTEAQGKMAASAVTADTGTSGGGGGGGRTGSVLDDLLQKLRRVQMATLGLTEGWKGAREALDGLFPGGGSNSPFEGIEQQMRRLGAKEDLITMIAGMDPEEFQKRKNELFTFDGAGNIVGFRNSLLSIGAAMRSIAFGDFQNEQQKNINVIRDQNTAIQKLIGLGYSMAEAYKMVENSAFASAIAQESNNEIIKKSAADYKEATRQAKLFAAAQAAASANESTQSRADTIAWLQQNSAGLSREIINEMLSNPQYAALQMSPTLTQEQQDALNTWTDNVENAANLEIEADIVPGNRDGMMKRFEDGFSKAMEKFSVMEKEIEIRFKVQKDPFAQTAEAAANLIDDIQNRSGGLDDLQAELDRIAYKEEDINKRYNERFESLNKIKQINDQISAQQKSQLSVADALSQGDIAGAARAAQEARTAAAERALSNEQKMLEQAKQAEIDALTAQTGMTREQIETRVRDLKMQILNIEETMLEPAQRALTLLERQEKKERESLTVLGRTRAEWEAIKNKIELAKVNSKEYEAAIKLALTLVQDILKEWKEIEKPKRTEHTIVTYHQDVYGSGNIGASGEGGNGGPPNQPGPTPTPTPTPSNPNIRNGLDITSLDSSVLLKRYDKAMSSGVTWFKPALQTKRMQFAGAAAALQLKRTNANIAAETAARKSLRDFLTSTGYNTGGLVSGIGDKDTIRAMLTPGEFVIRKSAVEAYGASTMKDINSGTFESGSVYNYSVNLNVKSESDADTIANVVIKKIQGIEDKRIRGNRF